MTLATNQRSSSRPRPRSFLDDLTVLHGPRSDLGLYFLGVEKFLADRDLTVQFAAFADIARLNAENLGSWDMLLPMLDPQQHAVEPDDAMAFLVYDETGAVVASMAARLFDFSGTTLKDEVEALRFYYGARASHMRPRVHSAISAPTAALMNGRSAYLGGYWLRPDVRATGLSEHLPKLMRYIALTKWNADLEFSYGRNVFLRPEIAQIYGFEHVEEDFDFYLDEKLIWRGVLVWTDRDEMLAQLKGQIAALRSSSMDGRRRDEQSPAVQGQRN